MFPSYRNRYQTIKDELDDYDTSTEAWRDRRRRRIELSLKLSGIFSVSVLLIFISFLYINTKSEELNNLQAPHKQAIALTTTWSWDTYPNDICIPGQFRSVSQLPHDRISLSVLANNGDNIKIDVSMYFTHNFNTPASINKQLNDIKSAIIIQHGNLRNGNDYFCGAINSLLLSKSSIPLQRFIVIAPQFFSDGDICWKQDKTSYSTINAENASTWCNLQIYSSDGWKDGHNSLNAGLTFYSYDLYNSIIQRLLNTDYFPNLEDITLFGFSAVSDKLL
jgi:hypothetical protein